VDARCDVYSVGILMYEMLTGVRPFTAETPVKILFLHLEGEPPPIAEVAPQLPESLQSLILSAMARSRDDRPAGAEELRGRILEELAQLEKAA
jgi:serine/threonine protein kinase